MLAFFKENLINRIVSLNDIVSFEIYGKPEQFQIESINNSTNLGKFLITEQFIKIIAKKLLFYLLIKDISYD